MHSYAVSDYVGAIPLIIIHRITILLFAVIDCTLSLIPQ